MGRLDCHVIDVYFCLLAYLVLTLVLVAPRQVCVDISKSCPTRMVKREQPPAADAGQGDADSQAAAKKEHEEL